MFVFIFQQTGHFCPLAFIVFTKISSDLFFSTFASEVMHSSEKSTPFVNLVNSSIKEKIHGRNLLPFSQKSNGEESAIYLHTIPYEKTSPDDKVGIRTQNYKYFRNSRDSGIDVNLYDLKNDNQ